MKVSSAHSLKVLSSKTQSLKAESKPATPSSLALVSAPNNHSRVASKRTSGQRESNLFQKIQNFALGGVSSLVLLHAGSVHDNVLQRGVEATIGGLGVGVALIREGNKGKKEGHLIGLEKAEDIATEKVRHYEESWSQQLAELRDQNINIQNQYNNMQTELNTTRLIADEAISMSESTKADLLQFKVQYAQLEGNFHNFLEYLREGQSYKGVNYNERFDSLAKNAPLLKALQILLTQGGDRFAEREALNQIVQAFSSLNTSSATQLRLSSAEVDNLRYRLGESIGKQELRDKIAPELRR